MSVRNIQIQNKDTRSSSVSTPPVSDDTASAPFPSMPTPESPKETKHEDDHPRALPRQRRRSIRDLPSEYDSGMAFQRYLEGIFNSRLLNVFFTIHIKSQEEPFYISETVQETANPQFRDLERNHSDENQFVITIWGKSDADKDYKGLFSKYVYLPDLKFIGSNTLSLSKYDFPLNSFIISLYDGVYVLPDTFSSIKDNTKLLSHQDTAKQASLSFDMLMKLSNLQACIADAANTRESAEIEIYESLQDKSGNLSMLQKQKRELKNRLSQTHALVRSQNLKNISIENAIKKAKFSIKSRLGYMSSGTAKQKSISKNFKEINYATTIDKTVIMDQYSLIDSQKLRIVQDLSLIFPLTPIFDYTLKFTICNIPFLDMSFLSDDVDIRRELELWVKDKYQMDLDDAIGAAYGFASQLVVMLSYYLGVSLRYPIQPFGSQSFIVDPISSIQGSRTFPLWTKGSLYFRFQYGAFLFNKNVEQLLDTQEIMIADINQVMANLQNLILVLSTAKC